MKKSFEVKEYINPLIKKYDIVRLIDGSGLTSVTLNGEQEVYIVFDYPRLTGLNQKLKDCDAHVIETNVKNYFCSGSCGVGYLQDIVIMIGDEKFRTCSKFVELKP